MRRRHRGSENQTGLGEAMQYPKPGPRRSVGVYEAKTHLPELLEEVGEGGEVVITRYGKPVAVLGPVNDGLPTEEQKARARAAMAKWDAYARDHHITLGKDLTIRQLIE